MEGFGGNGGVIATSMDIKVVDLLFGLTIQQNAWRGARCLEGFIAQIWASFGLFQQFFCMFTCLFLQKRSHFIIIFTWIETTYLDLKEGFETI